MATDSLPYISVITVNYNGQIYLKNLFESLNNQDYPREKIQIIMVDNASTDNSIAFTEKNYPFVEIIPCKKNTGFAEGNNIGLIHAQGELVALINNDCVAESNWLSSMVKTLLAKEEESAVLKGKKSKVGAIGSKILFYYYYYPLEISFDDSKSSQKKDDIYYGTIKDIRLRQTVIKPLKDKNSQAGSNSIKEKKEQFLKNREGSGYAESEENSSTFLLNRSIKFLKGTLITGKNAQGAGIYKLEKKSLLAIPVSDNGLKTNVMLDFSGLILGSIINISISGKELFCLKIKNHNENIVFDINKSEVPSPISIINSIGSQLNKKFYAREIAYEEFDTIEYDKKSQADSIKAKNALSSQIAAREVFAIPGTGFLCRKDLLIHTGFFDKKFFTYYEDIDFFWRLKLAGYDNYVCPDSVLRHFHCGSGSEWSYSFTYHVLRNRLIMIFKCAWCLAFIKNYLSFLASALLGLAGSIKLKIRRIPISRIDIPIRFKILFEFFILFFQKLPERIKIRKNASVNDKEIIKWLKDF